MSHLGQSSVLNLIGSFSVLNLATWEGWSLGRRDEAEETSSNTAHLQSPF